MSQSLCLVEFAMAQYAIPSAFVVIVPAARERLSRRAGSCFAPDGMRPAVTAMPSRQHAVEAHRGIIFPASSAERMKASAAMRDEARWAKMPSTRRKKQDTS